MFRKSGEEKVRKLDGHWRGREDAKRWADMFYRRGVSRLCLVLGSSLPIPVGRLTPLGQNLVVTFHRCVCGSLRSKRANPGISAEESPHCSGSTLKVLEYQTQMRVSIIATLPLATAPE